MKNLILGFFAFTCIKSSAQKVVVPSDSTKYLEITAVKMVGKEIEIVYQYTGKQIQFTLTTISGTYNKSTMRFPLDTLQKKDTLRFMADSKNVGLMLEASNPYSANSDRNQIFAQYIYSEALKKFEKD